MINELIQNLITINNSTEGQEMSFMNVLGTSHYTAYPPKVYMVSTGLGGG